MKKYFLILFATFNLLSQPSSEEQKIFSARREMFTSQIDKNSVAIFPCKPIYLRNLDIEYEYRQESNFYYLSGFEEPNSILVFAPQNKKYKYILYVRERDMRRETYDGPRWGTEGAVKYFGADTAIYFGDFEKTIWQFIGGDKKIYYTFGINQQIDEKIKSLFIERRAGGNYSIEDPHLIVAQMRLIKTNDDLSLGLKNAIDISVKAHIEAMRSINANQGEQNVHAIFEYMFRKNNSARNGYQNIIGSGANSTILHYNKNNRKMNSGEMILMDCGAEFNYYTADITRTVPVNGKFSKEQKEIYSIVLDAQNTAINIVKPGIQKSTIDKTIDTILSTGLLNLGFIKSAKDFKIFTLHGYSHWLGIDVHDVGAYTEEGKSVLLKEGMCFTIEPGIYIREDALTKLKDADYSEVEITEIEKKMKPYLNIGVRIEDDILVTSTGFENLSKQVPREISEIEKLMKEKGEFEP